MRSICIRLTPEFQYVNKINNLVNFSRERQFLITISAAVVFLFLAGLWFTEAIINGPNFHPKLTLAAPTIG